MEKPEQPKQEEERIPVGPLMFKPYQIHIMQVLAKVDDFDNIEEWLKYIILRDVFVMKLEGSFAFFAQEMLERLNREDGYGR